MNYFPIPRHPILVDDDILHRHDSIDGDWDTPISSEQDFPHPGPTTSVAEDEGHFLFSRDTDFTIPPGQKMCFGIPFRAVSLQEEAVLFKVAVAGYINSPNNAANGVQLRLGCGQSGVATVQASSSSAGNGIVRPKHLPMAVEVTSVSTVVALNFHADTEVIVRRPSDANTRRDNPFWFYVAVYNPESASANFEGRFDLHVRAARKGVQVNDYAIL